MEVYPGSDLSQIHAVIRSILNEVHNVTVIINFLSIFRLVFKKPLWNLFKLTNNNTINFDKKNLSAVNCLINGGEAREVGTSYL